MKMSVSPENSSAPPLGLYPITTLGSVMAPQRVSSLADPELLKPKVCNVLSLTVPPTQMPAP